jgi:hypothetical protein
MSLAEGSNERQIRSRDLFRGCDKPHELQNIKIVLQLPRTSGPLVQWAWSGMSYTLPAVAGRGMLQFPSGRFLLVSVENTTESRDGLDF